RHAGRVRGDLAPPRLRARAPVARLGLGRAGRPHRHRGPGGRWGLALSSERFHHLDLPVGLMTTGLLVVSSRDGSNVLRRALSWKPLVTVGAFSYSFYLIHAPLLQLLWQYVAHPLGLDSPATFAVLMTLGLAL